MALRYTPTACDANEVLDRILDNGLIVDAWLRIGLVGLEMCSINARFVANSLDSSLASPPMQPDLQPTHAPEALDPTSARGTVLSRRYLACTPPERNSIDVLERILDKGIVVDAWLRTDAEGLELCGSKQTLVVTGSTHSADRRRHSKPLLIR